MTLTKLFDLLLGKLADELDGKLLLLTGADVLSPDLKRAIGVDHEADGDLHFTAGGWTKAREHDLTE